MATTIAEQSLDRILKSRRLPLKTAIRYAIGIAQALADAHEKGSAHGALTPAKVMVADRGGIEIRNFGAPAASAPADVFAFGQILSAMTAGRTLPRGLRDVIAGCLRGDPRERWQNLADVKAMLEQLQKDLAEAPRQSQWRPGTIAAGALGGAALIIGIAWAISRPVERAASTAFVDTMVTADSGLTAYPALSKDGRILAYASDRSSGGGLDIWVQQTGGGSPIRLTDSPSDETDPDVSPDGTKVAFRSEKDGGGVYVAPTLGGNAILIAAGGRNPKFSPDGRWVAYWVGREETSYLPSSAKVFVAPSGGGAADAVADDFVAALYPIWSPRGDALLTLARRELGKPGAPELDWWVFSWPRPSAPVATRALPRISAEKLGLPSGYPRNPPVAWFADPSRVIFPATKGDPVNLWSLEMGNGYDASRGRIGRVTSGAAYEVHASRGGGRLAYSNLTLNFDVWGLPIDAETGEASGDLIRVTKDASTELFPSLSWDGGTLAYSARLARSWTLRIRDLRSASERTLLFEATAAVLNPKLSGDGRKIFYTDLTDGIFEIGSQGGQVKRLCERCGTPTDVSFDGGEALVEPIERPGNVRLLKRGDSQLEEAIPVREALAGARWSRDRKWIAFHASKTGSDNIRIFVAPADGERAPQPDRWIAITAGDSPDRTPAWSPKGSLLYFLSDRDGFRCIWAQRLDPSRKTPVGDAFAIRHFHTARQSLRRLGNRGDAIGLSVSDRLAVFTMGELTGNVWMREEKP